MTHNEKRILQKIGIFQLNGTQMLLETSKRVKCARLWCRSHWSLLCNPKLHCKTKFLMYKLFVRPILIYGCEVWNLNKRCCEKLLRFEYSILLEIFKSMYPRKHPERLRPTFESVYYRFQDSNIIEHVKNQRLRWNYLLQCEKRAVRHRNLRIQWWDQTA